MKMRPQRPSVEEKRKKEGRRKITKNFERNERTTCPPSELILMPNIIVIL